MTPTTRYRHAWLAPVLAGFATVLCAPCPADADGSDVVHLPIKRVRGRKPMGQEAELSGGQAVTVLSGDDLRRQHVEVAGALAAQPGLQVIRTGGVGSPAVLSVRGSTADQVRYLLDGAPMDVADGGALDLSDLPLIALERLEIYRGLAPLSGGAQPLGGTLRIGLRKAQGSLAEATAALGSYGTRQIELAASHRTASWGALASLRSLDTQGNFTYRNNGGTTFASADDRTLVRANNDLHRLGGTLNLDAQLPHGWQVALRWLGAGIDQGVPGAALFPALDARYAQSRHVAALTASRAGTLMQGDQLQLIVHGVDRKSEVDDRKGQLGLPWQARQSTLGAGALALWQAPLRADGVNDLDAVVRLTAAHAAVSGQDLLHGVDAPQSRRDVVGASGGLQFRHTSTAFVWHFVPSVGAEQAWQQLYDARRYPFTWQQSDAAQVQAWHAALATRLQPSDDWYVDLSARHAFRMPNLQELFGDSAVVVGNTRLGREGANSVECGVAGRTAVGPLRLAADVRGHATWAENLIQLVGLGPHQAMYQNVGDATLFGVDATATLRHGAWGLDVRHATLSARDHSGRPAYDGKALPMRPHTTWGATAQWRPGWAGPQPSAWLGAQWQAGYFLDSANLVAIGARTTLAAAVRLQTGLAGIYAEVRVDNLTNSQAFDLVGYPLAGRTLWLQVGWQTAAEAR